APRAGRRGALQGGGAVRRGPPAACAGHDRARGEWHGLPLPAAARRLHGLRAVLPHLSRFLLRGLPRSVGGGRRVMSESAATGSGAAERRVLMEGSHAIAEAAIQSGCRFYAGYPITPSTEILEYMSFRQ